MCIKAAIDRGTGASCHDLRLCASSAHGSEERSNSQQRKIRMYFKPSRPPLAQWVPPRKYLEPWRIFVLIEVLFLLGFFIFNMAKAPRQPLSPSDLPAFRSKQPAGFRPSNDSKIAIVTFSTEQKSYTHTSLRNKARTKIAWHARL